jgi:hypothetical protein
MNNFEDHIKRKLKNHTSPVDTDALWNSISEDIPKEEERKKRGIFFLFLFGLGIAGGMMFIYSNLSYQGELAHYFHKKTDTPLLAEDIHYENNMNSRHDDMMPPNFGYHVFDNNIASKLVTSNRIESTQASFINTVIFSTLSIEKDEIREGNSTNTFTSKSIAHQIEEPTTIAKEIIATVVQTNKSLMPVDLLDAEVFAMDDETIEKIVIEEYKEEEEVEKEKKKVKMAIGFTTGYSSSKSSFSTDLNKYEYYAIKRSNLEEHKNTMTLSGDFVLFFHNNIRFRTGVEYTRITELFSYYKNKSSLSSSKNSPEESVTNSSFNTNSSGENGNDDDTLPLFTSTRQLEFQSTNQHHFIDIPLIVGYEVGKKKLSLLIETGLSVKIRVASKGYLFLLDGNYANLNTIEPIFNRKINVASYTGLSLNYDLGKRTQLKLGGHFKYNPFSITKKNYPVKQKYRSTGIHIGILHQL